MYVVSLTDANGERQYYTGRSGQYFLSINPGEAFTYEAAEGAKRKAETLNKMIGGEYRFTASHRNAESNALHSIIGWTDAAHGLPDDPKARCEQYARLLMMIRNAARSGLQGTCR